MPELPEVETLRRELNRVLPNTIFKTAQVLNAKSVAPLSVPLFKRKIAGRKIKSVDRRAKMLIINLDDTNSLVFHLKMTGQLIYHPKKGSVIVGGHPEDPFRHTRIIFDFKNGDQLTFNDLRKFGWARLLDNQAVAELVGAVGIEPLSKSFTPKTLRQLFSRYPKRTIKQILLDQKLLAGIGNIYADEACFLAGVLPTRIAKKITATEIGKLHQAIVSVLKLSISKKGTSSRNYVRSDGSRGGFVPHLNVYGRESEPCKACGTPIRKIRHLGRGTHFCPHCQH